jgi:4-hydroxybutyryl-CoA dehydratase / vinylacetyl-CoA-Delta-isomerase
VLTGEEYRASLRDERQVQYGGRRIADVSREPAFQCAVDWTARGYTEHYDSRPGAVGPYFSIPRSIEELRAFETRLKGWDMATISTSQGLLMAVTAAERIRGRYPIYAERAMEFFAESAQRDVRCAMAITDAKGNRRLGPGLQPDPDHYVRIVRVSAAGVIIRGAKMHITSAVNGHELIVMPTKRMKAGEEAWAFAGAVPANAPGVKMVATSVAEADHDPDLYPYSSRYAVPEAMVIFDDVFVPNERVFLCGEVEHSGTWAHSLGTWERLGNLGHLTDIAHALVGFADLIAEANGLSRFAHVREKIGNMAIYATMLCAAVDAAIVNADFSVDGYVTPSELYTNAGKFYAAENFHLVMRDLHDIAGGAVLTAPSLKDLRNTDVGPYVEKYMRTMQGIGGEYRMRLFHAIRDYTADAYSGWLSFTILLGGGGLHAQRAVAMNHYDIDNARRLALDVADVTRC